MYVVFKFKKKLLVIISNNQTRFKISDSIILANMEYKQLLNNPVCR